MECCVGGSWNRILIRTGATMAKKSRKTAAKYSELGRAKKRKQRSTVSPEAESVAAAPSRPVAEARPAKTAVARAARKAQPEVKRVTADYSYVTSDLKRIGILTAGIAVVIIVLAFVLG